MTTPKFININQALAPLIAQVMGGMNRVRPGEKVQLEIVPVRAADEDYDDDATKSEERIQIEKEASDLRRAGEYLDHVAYLMEMEDFEGLEKIITDRLIDAADEMIVALDEMEANSAEEVETECGCYGCQMERSGVWSNPDIVANKLPVTPVEEEARTAVEGGSVSGKETVVNMAAIRLQAAVNKAIRDGSEEDLLSGIPLIVILNDAA